MRNSSYVVALVSLLVTACTIEAPATPSFQLHVMPILAANCVRCHGYPAIGGAPEDFRLDVFGNVVVRDGRPRTALEGPCGLSPLDAQGVICGAASLAQTSAARAASTSRPMPPRFSIADHQIETLQRWADMPVRGEPRVDNHAPTVELSSPTYDGPVVAIHVRVSDQDHDLVVGELWIAIAGRERLVAPLRSGTQTVRWNAMGIVAGTYPLIARVDDGAMVHQLAAGELSTGGN
jgi:hypothetical protein